MINEKGEQVGVIERDEALRLAQEAGLDLVEVQSDVRPPLVKIMDYGKYRFEMSKRRAAQNKQRKQNETKEIRLGRSVKIDEHDVALRLKQAREFLLEGYKVNFVQRFRGRELAHPSIGEERLNRIAEALSDIALLQTPPKLNGKQMTMLLNPDKRKIDAYQRDAERQKRRTDGGNRPAEGGAPPPTNGAPPDASTTENGASPA
ncbi:MAG: translation initiation factor IF-3 [Myxococcales bacterium]|nr:translation initiation factor IF-3 [Myxococcales bacterium]